MSVSATTRSRSGSPPTTDRTTSTATSYTDNDPVCIVGIACHLPGGIRSPSDLWDFLTKKRSAQSAVPPSRFNTKGYYHPDGNRAGVMNAGGGYFLQEDVRLFENSFFGINNIEASYMDPQQRKLLEVVFECLENAGETLENISGTNTGVYVGNFTVDYQTMQARDPDTIHRYNATGGGTTILANRISHVFNLQGPSFTLDTACSSSIYCIDSAVNALKHYDCDGAIVASVNLITAPEQSLATMKAGVLSPTSTCHTFDASADGYGRADGVNAVYLKRLSSAMRDGNKIWAVVRATAVNSNGRTSGITQPSANLQEAVIRKAYSNAGLPFADTDYVECHGTGTPVGDPIEVDAVSRCFSGPRESPLLIGSVKPNLGHSEAASGLTSLMKVILAFEHGIIPPTYGVTKVNPNLHIELSNMKIATEVEKWPRAMRRASINSFGYGGANAHAILEAFDTWSMFPSQVPEAETYSTAPDQYLVLPVSAASSTALDVRMEQISQIASTYNWNKLESLTYTLSMRRSQLKYKEFLVAKVGGDSISRPLRMESSNPQGAQSLAFAFIFTGQGAQYAGMAKELVAHNNHFLATIRELDRILGTLPPDRAPGWTIEESILEPAETSQVNKGIRSQTICTAIQIAIVDLLHTWNVNPVAVVGHSSGEISAAYAAGLISHSQAILVAYFRGYAINELKTTGSMMAVGLDAEIAQDLIQKHHLSQQVCVACINSPQSVTLSGSTEGIRILETEVQKLDKPCRLLRTDGRAYHSHIMTEVGELYENMLRPLFGKDGGGTSARAIVQMYSSVADSRDSVKTTSTGTNWPRYWRENLENPVNFHIALQGLAASRALQYIEIGPHPALKGPVNQIRASMGLGADRFRYAATLVRERDAELCMKELAGTLFVCDHSLNWQNINYIPKSNRLPLHDLPPYPWDYSGTKLLYHESRPSYELRNRKHVRHELLGSQQTAGNGIDWAWRNDSVRLKEMPWMRDHKVGTQIVFPAAGYLAMVIEGLHQIQNDKDPAEEPRLPAFEFRSVSFNAALVLHDQDGLSAEETELHTIISPRKMSTTSTSSGWYDFSISSWKNGKVASHCVGSIREVDDVGSGKCFTVDQASPFQKCPTDRWYDKFAEEGIYFGKHFQSVTFLDVDGGRRRREAVGTTRLSPDCAEDESTFYPMHPITIDACLQTGIMSTCAGNLRDLKAFLPAFITECRIGSVPSSVRLDSSATIHARSERTGLSTQRISCTLRDSAGTPLIQMGDVRMALYAGKLPNEHTGEADDVYDQRQPCLRVYWKPDIQSIQPGSQSRLRKYISSFVKHHQHIHPADDDSVSVIGALLDLAGHKQPRMRVLEIGENGSCNSKEWLKLLDKDTSLARCRSWHTASIAADGTLLVESGTSGPFDTIVLAGRISENHWTTYSKQMISLLASDGIIITQKTQAAESSLESADFSITEVDDQTLLAKPYVDTREFLRNKIVVIVVHEPSPTVADFASLLSTLLQEQASIADVKIISISDIPQVTCLDEAVCISLLEAELPYLPTMSQTDLDLLRHITNRATQLTWVTGASMLCDGKPNPDLTLSSGLSRAIMLEQPSLRFAVVDVGSDGLLPSNRQVTCGNLINALTPASESDDKEYIQSHGILYISRFGPESHFNSLFQRRQGSKDRIKMSILGDEKPARLSIGKVGVTDTIHFQQVREPPVDLPAGFVDVDMHVVSLNAKDVYALSGRVETQDATIAMEFGGVVTATGPGVPNTQLEVGDRVLVVAPNHFTTTARVPAWAAHRIKPDEDLAVLSAIPLAYCTALYALHDRAHLRADETILIHSGAGALGIAAITIAQRIGAVVYTTVGSTAKKDWIASHLAVPTTNIFHSRDATSFVAGVKEATLGRGVDVVLNSLTGDLMHASWDCLADFGRFVEVGKKELIDAGKLDMAVFLRNATFTAFDLSELYFHKDQYYRNLLSSKMAEVLELFRSGDIKPMPTKKFDVHDIVNAYRYFSTRDRVGKVLVSLENPESSISVSPAPYHTILDPQKVYLLVGCLGGVGRSLSRWFLSRGARNFVFLGRSGCDNPAAKDFVTRLREAEANVNVVRGDVCNICDVRRAIQCCTDTGRAIGGVVQASMGLSEGLFSRMTSEAWQKAIQPKWAGTWNLDSALHGLDENLDFFLLMSSISGTVGTATESNYCAANGFLDAFARKRRLDGKPTISLGLGMVSEVGYLHENPQIESLLLRRGIQPLDEDEFLQMADFALVSAKNRGHHSARDLSSSSHLLTGLEPLRIRQLRSQGFDIEHGSAHDPRASILSGALEAEREFVGNTPSQQAQAVVAAPWLKGVPSSAMATLMQQADAPSLELAVLRLATTCFSNLILLSADQIDKHKPLTEYGVDSMIASELRTWFWSEFKVDVPFLDILSQGKSLHALSIFVKDKLLPV